MPHPNIAVVTGAFSYTGRYVIRHLLDQGVLVRTLTRSLHAEDPFGGRVEVAPLDGLSPRLRGNPFPVGPPSVLTRSIPAPAGEPIPAKPVLDGPAVYPRACGGTGFVYAQGQRQDGLSPRLRGNRFGDDVVSCFVGSIPAPAGEPPSFRYTLS